MPNTKKDNKTRGQLKNISWKNKGDKFTFFSSYYVDDAAFILLNRNDAIEATKLMYSHFKRFGLTIHTGSKNKKEKSKTEFLVIPGAGTTPIDQDEKDIFINNDAYISFCTKFKYLGTSNTPSMKNSPDIQNRINKAQQLFFSLNKLVFRNQDISLPIRKRIYVAIVINILLWGCESWNLTSEDRRKLEVFHMRCCRRILNVSIYDVIANHELSNKNILRTIGISNMDSYIELRRSR